jgi:hypothetical protein
MIYNGLYIDLVQFNQGPLGDCAILSVITGLKQTETFQQMVPSYTYYPINVLPQLLDIREYQSIFESTNCTMSDARYKLLLGATGLHMLSHNTTRKLEQMVDTMDALLIETEMKRRVTLEINLTVSAIEVLPMHWVGFNPWGVRVDWDSYIYMIRTRLLSPSPVPPQQTIQGESIKFHDVVVRVLFLTYLGMQRYRDSGDRWFVHMTNQLHTYPVWSRLQKTVPRSCRSVRHHLKAIHYEFQRFKTIELR